MIARAWSFCLSAAAALALVLNATGEASHPVRFAVVLVVLFLLHLLGHRRLVFGRECALYVLFVGYMLLSLLWTDNIELATDTLLLCLDFILVAVLFGSLWACHPTGEVLWGTLGGFLLGAGLYTLTKGFPFVYPEEFSYNTIAGMYLFGLLITVLLGWHRRRALLSILVGLVLLLHIAATTSIKTNVGIVLGIAAAGTLYFGSVARVLRHILLPFVVLGVAVAYTVLSNAALMERVQSGFERVSKGVEILIALEDTSGTTAFGDREYWKDAGLQGWVRNPLFGHGVEAFRTDYGITSHSTPIDLLYNSGAIGLVLFYCVLLSLAWRMLQARDPRLRSLCAIIFAALTCYLFISLSGTMYYDNFLAAFVAIGSVLLRRPNASAAPTPACGMGVVAT